MNDRRLGDLDAALVTMATIYRSLSKSVKNPEVPREDLESWIRTDVPEEWHVSIELREALIDWVLRDGPWPARDAMINFSSTELYEVMQDLRTGRSVTGRHRPAPTPEPMTWQGEVQELEFQPDLLEAAAETAPTDEPEPVLAAPAAAAAAVVPLARHTGEKGRPGRGRSPDAAQLLRARWEEVCTDANRPLVDKEPIAVTKMMTRLLAKNYTPDQILSAYRSLLSSGGQTNPPEWKLLQMLTGRGDLGNSTLLTRQRLLREGAANGVALGAEETDLTKVIEEAQRKRAQRRGTIAGES